MYAALLHTYHADVVVGKSSRQISLISVTTTKASYKREFQIYFEVVLTPLKYDFA